MVTTATVLGPVSEAISPASESAWYCLRALSKREHAAAQLLRQREGLEVVMPRISYRKLTRRGVVKWVEPMFPCYLFAKLCLITDLSKVRSTSGISSVLNFNGKFIEIPQATIEDLKKQSGKEQLLELDNSIECVQPGDKVTLVEGAMARTKAIVRGVLPSQKRIEVLINFLGREQSVQLDWKQVLMERDYPTTESS